jgi:hypothetical protein
MDEPEGVALPQPRGSALEVLRASTRLGLTSFGGPIAHLGYLHEEYVVRRNWFGWKSVIDLGDISTARGAEMLLPMWLRLFMGVLKTPMFGFKVVAGPPTM